MLKKLMSFVLLFSLVQMLSAAELPDFSELVEKQGPAVVNISTTQIVRAPQMFQGAPNLPENDPFYEFFRRFAPQMPREQESQSLGSGFIISADGFILTNAHVVDRADKITVRLGDKREFKAKVIGADRRTDVALIKIEATGLPKVSLGNPEQVKVGEWVLAIGSPFGFDSSVTAGIVSAKGRSLNQENYVPFIQTDVAINPGNSGGPLFNLRGDVIGINSQIYSRSGGYMGLSFAIPIDVAMDIVNQLRTTGKVTRGRIGVSIQDVTRELADSFGLSKPAGALISGVEKGGPADKAGVKPSDVILKFDGKTVASSSDLPRIVAATRPGSKVSVQLWRKGSTLDVTLVVGEMQSESVVAESRPQRGGRNDDATASETRLGVVVSELNEQQKTELGVEGGLVIEDLKGGAARSQLQRGDVILAVGNIEIRSFEQFNEVIRKEPKGKNIALLVRRSEGTVYIPVKLDEK